VECRGVISLAKRAQFGIKRELVSKIYFYYMRYLLPMFLAALLPISSLAEGIGSATPRAPAATHLTLARAKAKKAPKAKKAKKISKRQLAKMAKKAKMTKNGKKRSSR
jgi:hypothetical protein